MKKIAIFNDYQLPLPAVKGGSVPTLTNFLLDENEKNPHFDIDVYSCYHPKAEELSKNYQHTRFIYSKDADKIRFMTNLLFVLKSKLKLSMRMSNIPMPRTAKEVFKNETYDVVYINGYIRGAAPIIRMAKSSKRGGRRTKCIIHHHVVTDILHESSIQGKDIVDSADKVCFVSDFATNYACTGTAEQNDKMLNFPNAIDTSRFRFNDRERVRMTIRDQYSIKETDRVILFVGRMVGDKGALEVIQAFNRADFDDSVKLMIVGGATYSSKKTTPYVEDCLKQAKDNSSIIFTGYVPYDVLPQYYCAADISAFISRCDEACGLVGIESMAAGLPVITTDRGGIGEYVTDECKIVTPDDENLVENVTAAMKSLAEDESLCRKMGLAGIERAKCFDKTVYFKKFADIVQSVLD